MPDMFANPAACPAKIDSLTVVPAMPSRSGGLTQ